MTPESFAEFDGLSHYSQALKDIIKSMMNQDPDKRPSVDELLVNFLQTEEEKDVKTKKNQNKVLKKEVEELGKKLGIRRKKST